MMKTRLCCDKCSRLVKISRKREEERRGKERKGSDILYRGGNNVKSALQVEYV